MISRLLIFSSVDGHTKKICNRIKSSLDDSSTKLIDLNEVSNIDIENYDQIIIGASIRYGKHRPELYKFIENNLSLLESKRSAFFTVNIVARKPEKNSPETNPYMKKFLKLSKWRPDILEVFAGRLEYPKYGFIDKYTIKFIMWITNGPTDVNGTFEFTDWEKVDEFVKKIS
tara:strand:+ start:50 stop:565 length:516 start_codon:yes stop_codon:yes gene_type:complete